MENIVKISWHFIEFVENLMLSIRELIGIQQQEVGYIHDMCTYVNVKPFTRAPNEDIYFGDKYTHS